MSTTPTRQQRILFVDDEAPFLEMIGRVMRLWAKDSWEILTAQSASAALGLLQDQPVNLVVIDVCMPVVDGLQFLALLNRKYPNLQKVVLTGYASESYRAACLSNGAELFLEKPRTVEGFESVFATLNELSKWQPEEGFRGVLRRVGLQDVIQMECLGRSSSILEVAGAKGQGYIYIRDGSIIHAQSGSRRGEEAFNFLLGLAGGEFHLRGFKEPPEESISGQWEFLLMEAARVRDEATEAASAVPEPEPESHEEALRAIVAEVPYIGTPAPGSATADLDQGVDLTEPAPVQELLVCSDNGDVLYEWGCPNVDQRINFLEFLSQKSRQLAQMLPLGDFDRLEVQGQESRLVARIRLDSGVVVRSKVVAPAGAVAVAPAASESTSIASAAAP